jgi:7,8-dihydro-6-hydroxymethylpterin-pyrophosphokinase
MAFRRGLWLLVGQVHIIGVSTFYHTKSVERPEQPTFINGVDEAKTGFIPGELKQKVLRGIEKRLGRRLAGDKYALRPIGLGLLV